MSKSPVKPILIVVLTALLCNWGTGYLAKSKQNQKNNAVPQNSNIKVKTADSLHVQGK